MLETISLIVANKALILGGLLGVSEALSVIPQVKANGVFQAVTNAIKTVAGK